MYGSPHMISMKVRISQCPCVHTWRVSLITNHRPWWPGEDLLERLEETERRLTSSVFGAYPTADMVVSINGGNPIAGWFIVENPFEMDDLGVPPILGNLHME